MSTELQSKPVHEPADLAAHRQEFWKRVLRVTAVFLVLAILIAFFYRQTYVGLTDREAEDIAQVARSVSEGKGFSTRFVRPFNTNFHTREQLHFPELNHAPLYVYAVAGLFKVRSPSDQVAIWTSLICFFTALVATYFLGSLLFDWRVGLLAAGVTGVSERVLHIAVSGLEWPAAAALFALLLCLVALHHRSVQGRPRKITLVYTALTAIVLGLLYITHHVFVFLAIPLAIYFAVTGRSRTPQLIVFLVVAVLALGPWAYRNAVYTGIPVFGVTAWDLMANTTAFPDDTFYRSTAPIDLSPWRIVLFPAERFSSFAEKVTRGFGDRLEAIIPMLGMVVLPFAIVGVLYRFKSPSANAVRGFIYGALPLMLVVFALFNVDKKAVIVFAPVVAVLASAYLLLLIRARNLHPFFVKTLVGGFLFVTAIPYLSAILWSGGDRIPPSQRAVNEFYVRLAEGRYSGLTYTDVPWTAAWRTLGTVVWLPRTDDDVWTLHDKGLQMTTVILTPESAKYSPDETWYMLHKVKLWRDYIRDPEEGLEKILEAARVSRSDAKGAEGFLRRLKRSYAISESVTGAVTWTQDPISPDDIQIVDVGAYER